MSSFYHNTGDKYEVTGVTRDGKRFKSVYSVPEYAMGINLWRGSVWQVKKGNDKRVLIKRVYN